MKLFENKIMKRLIMVIVVIIAVALVTYLFLLASQTRDALTIQDTKLNMTQKGTIMEADTALFWNDAFFGEMPANKPPYISINMMEVSDENYDNLINNVEGQQTGMELGMNEIYDKPYHYSVQQYKGERRILWINYFPEQYMSADPSERPSGFLDVFTEFAGYTDTYDWFTTQDLKETEIPYVGNTNVTPGYGEALGLQSPSTALPESDNVSELTGRMVQEINATPKTAYSTFLLDVPRDRYAELYANIQAHQSLLMEAMGSSYEEPYLYSAQNYDDVVRVIWMNEFTKDTQPYTAVIEANEAMLEEMLQLTEGYKWWASQAIDDSELPQTNLLQLIRMMF